jgi:hypothetical protein
VGVGGVTSTARSAVRASGEGRASVRAWTHTWERGAASTADLSSPVSPSWGGRGWARVGGGGHIDRALCRARERGGKSKRASLDVPGRGERRQRWTCPDVNGGEGVRGEGAVVQRAGEGRGGSGGDAPWYGERERERGGARAGRGRREACLAGGHGAVLVSSAAGAAEATIPPSCRGEHARGGSPGKWDTHLAGSPKLSKYCRRRRRERERRRAATPPPPAGASVSKSGGRRARGEG